MVMMCGIHAVNNKIKWQSMQGLVLCAKIPTLTHKLVKGKIHVDMWWDAKLSIK